MSKKIAILQSNYVPWKGYFDLINYVDEFIIYDTAQFTRNDWRNRNRLKTPQGLSWLTIPVLHYFGQLIQDTVIGDSNWARRHWRTIAQNYARAAHFADYQCVFEDLYNTISEKYISVVNYRFIVEICRILGINTKLSWSRDYELADGQTERLVHLCKQAGATEYLSGPAAKAYIDETLFDREGIRLTYIDYAGYPEYRQLHGLFEHGVSILDLILNEGPNATRYMKSFSLPSPDAVSGRTAGSIAECIDRA